MIVLMMGLPGSGKGSIAIRLETLGFSVISTGKIIRDEIFNETDLGKSLEDAVNKAEYVDDQIVASMVKSKFEDGKDLLIEGFPRNKAQANLFDDILEKSKHSIDLVLHFDFNEAEMYKRLKGRQMCKRCQAIYHEDSFPSADGIHCDECGAELVHRIDDQPEKLARKLEQYRKNIRPLIDHYREKGIVKTIDATQSTVDMYYDVIQSHKNFMIRA